MCQLCGKPCGCNSSNNCGCTDNTGCIVKLDATCILYHKNNNELSALSNLSLNNGATLELFMNTVDTYIGQIQPASWNLPVLRADYTINTLQQFSVAVDTEIGALRKFKGNVTVDPVGTADGDYWFRTDLSAASGLKIKLNGNVRTITTS